jgi:hypothetical protein
MKPALGPASFLPGSIWAWLEARRSQRIYLTRRTWPAYSGAVTGKQKRTRRLAEPVSDFWGGGAANRYVAQ